MSQDERDDDALWAEVTKSVRPANREDVLAPKPKIKARLAKPKPKAKAAAAAVPVAAKQVVKQGLSPTDLRLARPAGFDRSSARKLTKGTFEIDDRLDLHGMTEAIAHRRLIRFVQQAHHAGARTLLVITGKGAMGQGVLRRKVPSWIKEPPLSTLVLALTEASPKDGGGGALYLRLRRKREA